eukprot:1155792-Pelagomonas_calceolata.AAC.2
MAWTTTHLINLQLFMLSVISKRWKEALAVTYFSQEVSSPPNSLLYTISQLSACGFSTSAPGTWTITYQVHRYSKFTTFRPHKCLMQCFAPLTLPQPGLTRLRTFIYEQEHYLKRTKCCLQLMSAFYPSQGLHRESNGCMQNGTLVLARSDVSNDVGMSSEPRAVSRTVSVTQVCLPGEISCENGSCADDLNSCTLNGGGDASIDGSTKPQISLQRVQGTLSPSDIVSVKKGTPYEACTSSPSSLPSTEVCEPGATALDAAEGDISRLDGLAEGGFVASVISASVASLLLRKPWSTVVSYKHGCNVRFL